MRLPVVFACFLLNWCVIVGRATDSLPSHALIDEAPTTGYPRLERRATDDLKKARNRDSQRRYMAKIKTKDTEEHRAMYDNWAKLNKQAQQRFRDKLKAKDPEARERVREAARARQKRYYDRKQTYDAQAWKAYRAKRYGKHREKQLIDNPDGWREKHRAYCKATYRRRKDRDRDAHSKEQREAYQRKVQRQENQDLHTDQGGKVTNPKFPRKGTREGTLVADQEQKATAGRPPAQLPKWAQGDPEAFRERERLKSKEAMARMRNKDPEDYRKRQRVRERDRVQRQKEKHPEQFGKFATSKTTRARQQRYSERVAKDPEKIAHRRKMEQERKRRRLAEAKAEGDPSNASYIAQGRARVARFRQRKKEARAKEQGRQQLDLNPTRSQIDRHFLESSPETESRTATGQAEESRKHETKAGHQAEGRERQAMQNNQKKHAGSVDRGHSPPRSDPTPSQIDKFFLSSSSESDS